MRAVILATCSAYPDLGPDDQPLLHALRARGVAAGIRVWSDRSAWGGEPGVVIVRSCWDYHLALDQFLDWIALLAMRGWVIANPPSAIVWSARKRYLLELEALGIDIPVTRLVSRMELLPDVLSAFRPDSPVVVKPEVSASALHTHMLPAPSATLPPLPPGIPLVLQEFVPEINSVGEVSLMWFGGSLSHAVVKRPKPGDFRVQEKQGGTVEPIAVADEFLAFGKAVLNAVYRCALTDELTFARIDFVPASPFRLMEVELIEPVLFLRSAAAAADRLAAVIARRQA